jgi:hypothetical protein
MDCRGGKRVALFEQGVDGRCAFAVVALLPALARPGRRRGWHAQVRERRAQVEAGAAGEDGRPAGREELVDGSVRELGVLGDGGLVQERPDRDEPCRPRRLRREHRHAAVDLHRVGRDDLAAEPVCDGFGDRGLPGCRRPEDGQDLRGHAPAWRAPLRALREATAPPPRHRP